MQVQAAVYAVRTSGRWKAQVSLDMSVDVWWWLQGGANANRNRSVGGNTKAYGGGVSLGADKLVLLGEGIPLGWAEAMAADFAPRHDMDGWGDREWGSYRCELLEPSLALEPESGRGKWRRLAGEVKVWRADSMEETKRREWSVDRTDGDSSGEWRALLRQRGMSGGEDAGLLLRGGIAVDHLLDEAMTLGELMEGRALLSGEVEGLMAEAGVVFSAGWRAAAQLGCLLGRLRLTAGLGRAAPRERPGWLRRRRAMALRCRRCGSGATSRTACAACGSAACAYCEACLAMGRSRACALLLQGAAQPAVQGTAGGSPTEAAGRWGLSAAQGAAAGAALRFLAEPPAAGSAAARFLIWAVTGAGKTEMIFPLLSSVLEAGGRVLVAAPRRDVVLELAPRLAAAFPGESLAVLYGGSQDRWKRCSITLATTHQLLRLKNAFDLVVIDEIDAFPYHNDPMLEFAAREACKPGGKYIYLSATPPSELQRAAASGRLPHAKVPARYHGHPLPVPRLLAIPSVKQWLSRRHLPSRLVKELRSSLDRGAQLFLFVSRIKHIEPVLTLLRSALPGIPVEGTSSVDPARADKVSAFRQRKIHLLVTTTILERGVTVPMSDVIIVDADSELFDEAALIQMAGRAGRSKDDPAGRVTFASAQRTRSQRAAVRQIQRMNRIASKGGYLKERG